jgi:hypothetical protein
MTNELIYVYLLLYKVLGTKVSRLISIGQTDWPYDIASCVCKVVKLLDHNNMRYLSLGWKEYPSENIRKMDDKSYSYF